jgi:hypothetical protein
LPGGWRQFREVGRPFFDRTLTRSPPRLSYHGSPLAQPKHCRDTCDRPRIRATPQRPREGVRGVSDSQVGDLESRSRVFLTSDRRGKADLIMSLWNFSLSFRHRASPTAQQSAESDPCKSYPASDCFLAVSRRRSPGSYRQVRLKPLETPVLLRHSRLDSSIQNSIPSQTC